MFIAVCSMLDTQKEAIAYNIKGIDVIFQTHYLEMPDSKKALENFLSNFTGTSAVGIHRISDILSETRNRIQGTKNYTHLQNKAFCEVFGGSRKRVTEHVNKLQYKVFIAKYDKEYRNLAVSNWRKGKPRYDSVGLSRLDNSYENLKQVKEDGIWNVAPVVYQFEKSPSELKRIHLGKGIWKKVTKNSFHRNKLLSRSIFANSYSKLQLKDSAEKVIDLPSTLLVQSRRFTIQFLQHAAMHMKGKWSKHKEMRDAAHLFYDTERMLRDLGRNIDITWSPRRIKEEHDLAVKEINKRNASDVIFPWMELLPDCLKEIEHNGFKARLLMSKADMLEEGREMNHCVGMYGYLAQQEKYAAYSITKNGERQSTVGIVVDTDHAYFQQQFRKYNAVVTDKIENEFGKLLADKLNKYVKEQNATTTTA